MKIITNKNPYKLDIIADTNYPALTPKNVEFIEAVIALDSNYKKDSEIIPPDDMFDPITNSTDSKNLYCGSTKYWFVEMEKGTIDFKKCLMGAIISIDRANSTHLEAAKSGRLEMVNIIYEKCKNINDLKSFLIDYYDIDSENNLIRLMCKPLLAVNKNSMPRINLSFASKFCSYAANYLRLPIEYSKYDSVVSKILPQYCELYIGETFSDDYFLGNRNISNKDISSKIEYKLDIYKAYSNSIDKIIEQVKKTHKFNISKEQFDHILWYGFKGK